MTMEIRPIKDDPFSYRTMAEVESSGSSEDATIGPYDGMLVSCSVATETLKFRPTESTAYFAFTFPATVSLLNIAWNGMSSATSSVIKIAGLNY